MSAIFEISEATLIGRAAELTQIRETLDSVTDGRSQLLVISGEPGIGKTRLLQELAVEAQLRGYRVFSGRGTELETETPFAPLIEALDNELALSEPETLKELRERLPDLLGVFPSLGRRDPASAGSGSERFRHHRAVRELLQELAVVMPLLLIIDDIHWADAASIETIAHLLRHPPDAPVLVALAHRTANPPALLSAVLDAAVREAHVSELRLATFTEEEAAALLASAPEQTRGQIFRESGGNPFYIEQLMRAMSGWHPSQPESERSGFEIPRAVAGAISQELRQLEADAARMLEGAAVVGDPFDPMLACEAGDVDPDRALELLDELAARDLIRASAVGAGTFRFRHPLVRRAVYDSLAPGKRIAMHRRAANALEEFQAPTLAIAHHLSISARRGDRHAITVLASAAAEVAAAAPASAVGWLRVALSLLPEGPSPERLALLSSLAESQTSAGSLPDAHATLLEIVDTLSDQGGAPWTQAVAGLASVELALGRQAGMRDRLASALVAIPEQQAAAGTPLLIVSALDAAFEGDFAGAERSASTAVSLSEGMPVPQIVSRALLALVLQLQGDGRIAIAEAHLREAHTEFERLNDDELHGHLEVPWMLGMTEFQLEHFEDSVRHLQRGVDLARSTADGQHLAQTRTFLAYGLLHLGRMEEARRVAEEALDAGRLLRAAAYSAWATVVAATVWSLDDRRRRGRGDAWRSGPEHGLRHNPRTHRDDLRRCGGSRWLLASHAACRRARLHPLRRSDAPSDVDRSVDAIVARAWQT